MNAIRPLNAESEDALSMSTPIVPPVLQTCTKCGETYPLAEEFWPWRLKGRKFHKWCWACKKSYDSDYRQAHKDHKREYDVQYHLANAERIREQAARLRQEHPDRNHDYWVANKAILREKRRLRDAPNADKIREYEREYRARNAEKIKARHDEYIVENWDKIREHKRAFRRAHSAEIQEYNRQYQAKNHEVMRVKKQRYRTRMSSAPFDWTTEDALRMFDYWDSRCAYCGNPPGLLKSMQLTADHYIPLSLGGATTPENMVPACHSCNSGKKAKHPHDFLEFTFGKRKARKIEKAIAAYFASLKKEAT